MRRLLGPAWHPDLVATVRDVCAGARRRHGAAGYALALFAEITNLLLTALRTRVGGRTPITGGHSPHTPRKAGSTMRAVSDDLINGWRRIARQPRAALGVIALLTLAIGVASAMFTVMDAFIVRPAPFRDADRLHSLWLRGSGARPNVAAARALRDSGHFDAVHATVINAQAEFLGPSGPDVRMGAWIPAGTFADLGVSPLLGREFITGEGTEGNDGYVLLSESVWRDVFEADPVIAGRTVQMSGRPTIVVGVMPDRLRFPNRGDGMWRPLDLDRPSAASQQSQMLLFVRRTAGMPIVDAERLAGEVASSLAGPGPVTATSRPMGSQLDDYSRESLVSLAIGVCLIFVLLCANVTNLILARTAARRQEFGVCTALGASRFRLLRQVLLEHVAVGITASVLGLGLAYALIALANATLPEDLLWRTLNTLDVDFRAVAATSVIGLLAVLLAGLPAAWFGTRIAVNESIGTSRGGTDTLGGRRLTRALLVVEVAMAVAVLASAGLHVRSFVNLVNADRGLDTDRVLVATLTMPGTDGVADPSNAVIAADAQDRVAALPGIERVNRTANVPPDYGSMHFGLSVTTDVPGGAPVKVELMRSYYVGAGFFDTFGIRIIDGRGFERADNEHTVVLSEKLAHQLYGTDSPVGRTLNLWNTTHHIVGVATEIRNSMTEPREDHPEFYQFWAPSTAAPGTVRLGIRCAMPCASQESIRQAIESVSAGITITSLRPLSDDFSEQLARPKMAAIVAAAFSGLALLATAAGLYGVLAYAVTRRRREFGIRAALGAHPTDLRRLVLRDGVAVTAIGLVVGLGAGWGLARWLESVRYGVTFLDPLTWGTVTVTVLVVAVAASWLPARAAMRVDPAEMLRDA